MIDKYNTFFVHSMKILELIPTPGLFTSGDYRKDGLTLFAKLIRTKTVEGMDGGLPQNTRPDPVDEKKLKLKVSLHENQVSFKGLLIFKYVSGSPFSLSLLHLT